MDNSCRDLGVRPTGCGFPVNATAQQLSVDVLPTRTVNSFRAGGAVVNLTFTTHTRAAGGDGGCEGARAINAGCDGGVG